MLYASDTIRCAFWKTLARNRFVRRRRRELPRSEVEARLVVSIGSAGPFEDEHWPNPGHCFRQFHVNSM